MVTRSPSRRLGQPSRRITENHAFGPPSLNEMSFRSGRTSNLAARISSTAQPSAKASRSSRSETRLGPWVPGSSSLKHSRKSRPPGLVTWASPAT